MTKSLFFTLVLVLFSSTQALGEEVQAIFLVQYQVPENWPVSAEDKKVEASHLRYMQWLHKNQILVMGGAILENGHRLVVLRETSLESAIKLVQRDPAIQSGAFGAKVNTWDLALSSLWPKLQILPSYDPVKPFTLERLDPSAPINLKSR